MASADQPPDPGRREFLAAAAGAATLVLPAAAATRAAPALQLRIAPTRLELAPGVSVATLAYNGRVPGPVLRLRHGRTTEIEVHNDSDVTDLVHWHGLHVPADVDGAHEEGSLPVPPGGTQRYRFRPRPAGTHWYHTHHVHPRRLDVGAYTGLFGFVLVDDGSDPGDYDQEVLIAMHHWGAHWVEGALLHPDQPDHGLEIAYTHASMNDRLLGHGEPIRVRAGSRVLLRLLNASATEITFTHLPRHRLQVLALDGQPVPVQREIDVLMLGPGERADVLVLMDQPGVWILGSTAAAERERGLGVVIEYAGARGAPRWEQPARIDWDYGWFARPGAAARPDQTFELRVTQRPGGPGRHDRWAINGEVWPHTTDIELDQGRRYRLRLHNATRHGHPLHLHRHHFELASYAGVALSGLRKDTLNVRPATIAEVDFVANNRGPTLFHCHQAKHQDHGLMLLLMYRHDSSAAVLRALGYRSLCRSTPELP